MLLLQRVYTVQYWRNNLTLPIKTDHLTTKGQYRKHRPERATVVLWGCINMQKVIKKVLTSSPLLATRSPHLAITSPLLATTSPLLVTTSPLLATTSPFLVTTSSLLATTSPLFSHHISTLGHHHISPLNYHIFST